MRPSLTFCLLLFGIVCAGFVFLEPRFPCDHGARPDAAQWDIRAIKTAFDRYLETGHYPKSFQDLLEQPTNEAKWHGPYFDPPKIPLDPWGNPYVYEFPGKHNSDSYDLYSLGPDGKAGTDDDIGNWQ